MNRVTRVLDQVEYSALLEAKLKGQAIKMI